MAEDIRNFNTEELIDCLQDLPGRVHTFLRQKLINGRSFLLLTDEELLRLGMKEVHDRRAVLQKIRELKPEIVKEKSKLKTCQPFTIKVEYITIEIQTVLPVFIWGWNGEKCHVAISMSFESPERDVFIPFQITGATTDGHIILQSQLQLETTIIKQHNYRFAYKYVVSTELFQNKLEHIFYSSMVPGIKRVNRLLLIPENDVIPRGVFRYYDVMIYPDKNDLELVRQKGQILTSKVQKYFKKSFPDIQVEVPSITPDDSTMRHISLHTHLLQYQRIITSRSFTMHSSTVDDISRTIVSIYTQIYERHVQVVYPAWTRDNKYRLEETKQWIMKWLVETAAMVMEDLQRKQTKASSHTSVISGAILLIATYDLQMMKLMNTEQLLCLANLLHIQPSVRENGSKFCPSFDVLIKCLAPNEKNRLKSAIEKICQLTISQTKGNNIDWLYLLPLYHLLTPNREPFMELPKNCEVITWNFWNDLTDNKNGFQEYVHQSKYVSFKNLWRAHEDLMSLDHILMTVLMYMCPQNELSDILQLTPPILGISYLIDLFDKKKNITYNELKLLLDWLDGIQVSIVNLDVISWDKMDNELFEASLALVKSVANMIQSCNMHYFIILKKTIDIHLYIMHKLDAHGKGKSLKCYLDKTDAVLCQWINHPTIIGSNRIGGNNASKLNDEIKLWYTLIDKEPCQKHVHSLWRDKLKEIIGRRAKQVPDEIKLSVFVDSHLDDDCPEPMLDVFIGMVMEGLLSFITRREDIYVISPEVKNVCEVLSQFLMTRSYNKGLFYNGKIMITLNELLEWEIWPHFIAFACKLHVVFEAMITQPAQIINAAVKGILDLHRNITTGDITRNDLLKVMENKPRVQQLLHSATLTLDLSMYEQRLVAFESHITAVNALLSNIESDIQGYKALEEAAVLTVDKSKLMNELFLNWYESKDEKHVFQLLHESPLYNILHPFSIMTTKHRCVTFLKILESFCNEQKKRVSGLITQQQFVEEVWKGCINKCYTLLATCVDGSASALELDELFQDKQIGQVIECQEIQFNLITIHNGLTLSFPDRRPPVPPNDQWDGVSNKIVSFHFPHKTANYFLRVKNYLHYEGRYKFLEGLAEGAIQLKDIDKYVVTANRLLSEVSSKDRQECLKSLVESWEIVKWIELTFIDTDELQAFLDAAKAVSDELDVKKLNALRIVGHAVAEFVAALRKNLQGRYSFFNSVERVNSDKSSYLIKFCQGLWTSLEKNKQLPFLLKECAANIEWFKSIEQTHGALHYTTLQLQQLQESTVSLQLTERQVNQELKEKEQLISDLEQVQTTLQHQITEHEDREKLLQQQLQNQEEREQQQLQDSEEKEKVLRQERNELRQECNDVHQKLQQSTVDFQKKERELHQELQEKQHNITDLEHIQTTLQHEIKEHENKESLLQQQLQAQEKREQQYIHDSQERERVLLQKHDSLYGQLQESTIALQRTMRRLHQEFQEKQKVQTEPQREHENGGQQQLQDQQKQERILRQERDDFHQQLNELTAAFQKSQQTNATLQQKYQKMQQDNITLRQQVQETQQANSILQNQIEHFQEQSHWIVRREDIKMTKEVLGKGSWGEVKVAKFRGLRVAAKCLHDIIMSPYNISVFTREMEIAARVRHPNLLQFIGATRVGTAIILTELMPTSLRQELEKSSLTRPQIIKIATDVSAALNYLHLWTPVPILHRDVSSPNVLLEPSGSGIWKAKLSDYGSANLVQSISAGSVAPGNPFYAAPEAPFPDQHTPAMDVYSFGVLLMEMILGQLPGLTTAERIAQAETIQWSAMKPLVQSCIVQERKNRLSIAKVLTDLEKLTSI